MPAPKLRFSRFSGQHSDPLLINKGIKAYRPKDVFERKYARSKEVRSMLHSGHELELHS